MNKAWDKIKQKWEEDPMMVIFVGSLAATAAAKLIEANTNRANSRSWDRETRRRDRMTR